MGACDLTQDGGLSGIVKTDNNDSHLLISEDALEEL
jgi:hypothetical protein